MVVPTRRVPVEAVRRRSILDCEGRFDVGCEEKRGVR